MFKNIFIDLCNRMGKSPSAACRDLGLSPATFSCWTDESVPRRATLQRMAEYFGVSIDYLLGKEKALPELKNEHEEDELWEKITQLDEIDRNKVDGFVSGLLAAEKYQPTHQLKIAARGGGIREITVTDDQLKSIINLPEVTDLGDKA